jgi:uncharacterized protein
MTTIGVIADTHVPQRLNQLPPGIFTALRGVDLILHAGDLTSLKVLHQLAEIAPVQAVVGNADLFHTGLPLTRLIEVEGKQIGLVHGHGDFRQYLRAKVRELFVFNEEYYLNLVRHSFGQVDAIVFGHTHRFHHSIRSGAMLFNPGPIAPRYYNTPGPQIGKLHVSHDSIEVEVVPLSMGLQA